MLLSVLIVTLAGAGVGAGPGDGTRQLVGVLLEDGVERCVDGESRWSHPHYVVGFTPLKPASGVDLAPYVGEIVVVTGAPDDEGLEIAPTPDDDWRRCPPMQMRSDWVRTKAGVKIRRDGMGPVAPAFRVTEVAPFEALRVARRGDVLHVALTNPFHEVLRDATVTVHYEGCYGKPGTMSRSEHATLAPGETLEATFPRFAESGERPNRRWHRAFSAQVTAEADTVAFDLDRQLADEGAKVDCADKPDDEEPPDVPDESEASEERSGGPQQIAP